MAGRSLGVAESIPTLDGLNVTGNTQLGDAATDLNGFWGATPRVQMTTIASIGATATTAILKARINSMRTFMRSVGLMG